MRLWHPQHGIVFTTDQAEIDRLISTGGSEFDVNEKPWIKKAEEVNTPELTTFIQGDDVVKIINPSAKRGRPFKHNGNN